MNKARKKTYKSGKAKKLVRESFILSSTRYLSSRIVRFFESGKASPILTSAKKVNRFAREKVTGPLYKRIGIRSNFAMPARNAVASFVSHNPIIKGLNAFRTAFLNTSLRTVGVFLLTFGIYAAAIFLLKSYISLALGTAASVDDLSFAAITALVGLLLTAFGEKSILNAVGNSRIIGSLLSNCLGVNDSSLDRYSQKATGTAVGFGFLLGSVFGISTLFFTPLSVMCFLLTLILGIAIFHIPEFGILLGITTFTFVPVGVLASISTVTLISYLLKCVRLKRNLRFGTADALVLLMFLAMFIGCLVSDGGISQGEYYLLAFAAVYFAAKNLLITERLVVQTFNALCTGVSLGMALYILGDFATLIAHEHLRSAAMSITAYVMDPDALSMAVLATLPFALMSFSRSSGMRSRLGFLFLAAICAVFIDSVLLYVLLPISLFVFVSVAYKAPVGALLGAFVVIPPIAVLSVDYTATNVVALGARTVYDASLSAVSEDGFVNFWSDFYKFGGGMGTILFIAALLFIFQRVFGVAVSNNGNKMSLFVGTVAASAIVFIVCSFIFNFFSDLRIYAVMWFVFGFCGSIYKVASLASAKATEE